MGLIWGKIGRFGHSRSQGFNQPLPLMEPACSLPGQGVASLRPGRGVWGSGLCKHTCPVTVHVPWLFPAYHSPSGESRGVLLAAAQPLPVGTGAGDTFAAGGLTRQFLCSGALPLYRWGY